MSTMRGADLVAACLGRMQVQRVYGVIGTSIVGLIDGLYQARETIRYVSCRHEQVAASMADAEGRLTRRPGVTVLHSGPGTLNAMISMANAAKDCSPMIAISGATKRRLRGCDGMLELDHVRVFAPLCRATYRVNTVDEIPLVFGSAYQAAMSGPGGPVLVEVAEDLWTDRGAVSLSALDLSLPAAPRADEAEVEDALRRLAQARRPLILAGSGVSSAWANNRLLELAERLQAPVATTGNGRGALPETHPLCLGRAGFGGGNIVADEALRRADFILGIGCTLSDMSTYEYTWPIVADVLVANLDRDNDQKKFPVEAIYADAGEFLAQLLEKWMRENKPPCAQWTEQLAEARTSWGHLLTAARQSRDGYGSPAQVAELLDSILADDAIVAVGAGMHLLYPSAFIRTRSPNGYLSAVNFGSMGFGLAAAMAAKLTRPDRTVIAWLGDGDFLMTVQDLETAVRESIPIKIFVVNDNSYRVLAFRQRLQFEGHVHGSMHANPNLLQLADSFGIRAWRLNSAQATESVVRQALAHDGPALVEIVTATDDLPPTNLQAAMRMSE